MGDSRPRVQVVLCWHMHQPYYLDPVQDRYELPWTYLHGIKDYVDMVAHLEQVPEARAVVNFTPTLLEQIDDYAGAIHEHLETDAPLRDPLLAALGARQFPEDAPTRLSLIRACLRANEHRLIDRFAAFRRLADLASWLDAHPELVGYVSESFMADLLVWYHLAWLGETVRRGSRLAQELIRRARGFTYDDRRRLLELIGELLAGMIARYRSLAQTGQIELSLTPYAHPIMPLLLDFKSARQAVAGLELPEQTSYPGGEIRARRHVTEALEVFERHFGYRPVGVWPAEGAVCERSLALLEEFGFQWAATGGQVLKNSLDGRAPDAGHGPRCIHRPYALADDGIVCFFRDDGLSDLIGFSYSDWHAEDAVGNLIHHLEHIALSCRQHEDAVVSIILDGENAWEYYPENGYYFLHSLYRRLVAHPELELTTFQDCLLRAGEPVRLQHLVAGSWVYGTFTTWIGHPDKNRAWQMLREAKCVYDEVMGSGKLDAGQQRRAEHQLAICEGSDWFWWFGDDNPADSVQEFDRLFREQLMSLYELLGRAAPEYLAHAFTHGGGDARRGGVMRPGTQSIT